MAVKARYGWGIITSGWDTGKPHKLDKEPKKGTLVFSTKREARDYWRHKSGYIRDC